MPLRYTPHIVALRAARRARFGSRASGTTVATLAPEGGAAETLLRLVREG